MRMGKESFLFKGFELLPLALLINSLFENKLQHNIVICSFPLGLN